MLGLGSGINKLSSAEAASIAARSGSSYLLDDYSGAAAAYSLRQLSSSYSGNAVKVRRASDNAEADIRFVNGAIDTTGLANHCGSSDGFVSLWYDQSSSGQNVRQTVANLQPKIYDGTTGLVTENGKPAMQFDGTSDKLSAVSAFLNDNDVSVVFVGARNIVSASNNTVSNFTGGAVAIYSGGQDDYKLYHNGSYAQGSGAVGTSQHTYTFNSDGINFSFFVNGSSVYSGTKTLGTGTRFLEIGSFSGGNLFNGTIQEAIVYSTDQSSNRTGIESNINTFYSIYT